MDRRRGRTSTANMLARARREANDTFHKWMSGSQTPKSLAPKIVHVPDGLLDRVVQEDYHPSASPAAQYLEKKEDAPEEWKKRLPARKLYVAACRQPSLPTKPISRIMFGLDEQQLSLRHRHLSDTDVLPLALALRDGDARSMDFDLSHCALSSWGVAAICDALLNYPMLRSLDLSGNDLGHMPRAMHAVIRLVVSGGSLSRLHLSRNDLDVSFVRALARSLSEGSAARLEWAPSRTLRGAGHGALGRRGEGEEADLDGKSRVDDGYGEEGEKEVKLHRIAVHGKMRRRERMEYGQARAAANETGTESETNKVRGKDGDADELDEIHRRAAHTRAGLALRPSGGSLPFLELLTSATPPALAAAAHGGGGRAAGAVLAQSLPDASRTRLSLPKPSKRTKHRPALSSPIVSRTSSPHHMLSSTSTLPMHHHHFASTGTLPSAMHNSASLSSLPQPAVSPLHRSLPRKKGTTPQKSTAAGFQPNNSTMFSPLRASASVTTLPSTSEFLPEMTMTSTTSIRGDMRRTNVRAAQVSADAVLDSTRHLPVVSDRMAVDTYDDPELDDLMDEENDSHSGGATPKKHSSSSSSSKWSHEQQVASAAFATSGVPTSRAIMDPPMTALGVPRSPSKYSPVLRHVDLAGNGEIGPSAGAALAKLALSGLETLSIAWCPVGSRGAEPLLGALSSESRLRRLDMRFCGIDDGVAAALDAALRGTKHLVSLDMSHNAIGPRTGHVVATALSEGGAPALRRLYLGFNPIGLPGCRAILLSLVRHTALEELGLENAWAAEIADAAHSEATAATDSNDPGQSLWNRARRVNMERPLPARVAVEYPPRRRRWNGEKDQDLDQVDESVPQSSAKPNSGPSTLSSPTSASLHLTSFDADAAPEGFSLASSVFAARALESESRAFFDTEALMHAAFAADWEMSRTSRLVRDPGSYAVLRSSLLEAYPVLRETFRAYALSNPEGDPFDCSYEEMLALWREAEVGDSLPPARQADAAAALELAWLSANYEATPSAFNPADSLLRHEFLEAVARVALALAPSVLGLDTPKSDEERTNAVVRFLRLLVPRLRLRLGQPWAALARLAATRGGVVPPAGPAAVHTAYEEAVEAAHKAPARERQQLVDHAASLRWPVLRPEDVAVPGLYTVGLATSLSALQSVARRGVRSDTSFDPSASGASPSSPFARSSRNALPTRPSSAKRRNKTRSAARHAVRGRRASLTTQDGPDDGTIRLQKLRAARTKLLESCGDEPKRAIRDAEELHLDSAKDPAHKSTSSIATTQKSSSSNSQPALPPRHAPANTVANPFRALWLYRIDVHLILARRLQGLRASFARYSGKDARPEEPKYMTADEWLALLARAGVLPSLATEQHALASFVWASMTVVDELRHADAAAASRRTSSEGDLHNQHTLVEFLEAIARLAAILPGMPVDEEARRSARHVRWYIRRASSPSDHPSLTTATTNLANPLAAKSPKQKGADEFNEALWDRLRIVRPMGRRAELHTHLIGTRMVSDDELNEAEAFGDTIDAIGIDAPDDPDFPPEGGATALDVVAGAFTDAARRANVQPKKATNTSTPPQTPNNDIKLDPSLSSSSFSETPKPLQSPQSSAAFSDQEAQAMREADAKEDTPQRQVLVAYLERIDFLARIIAAVTIPRARRKMRETASRVAAVREWMPPTTLSYLEEDDEEI